MKSHLIQMLLLIGTLMTGTQKAHAQYQYPFQNPNLPVEKRIDNILSLMTLDEKVSCLSTDPSVPRLGIKGATHVEGLHGVSMGGPANWGKYATPTPTTTFPQAYGLAETWDPALLKKVAAVEGYETRYLFQNSNYKSKGLVVRAPNADLGRDPRWGRTEECYGEDPFFNGTMVTAFVKGLQGNNPKYWLTASLMKHFLANSNEDERTWSSSNFNERLFREYYSVPFRMGIEDGGSQAYMAAYNSWNEIPMMVNPVLKNVTVKEWGQKGIICTDGGALKLLISDHKYYPDLEEGAAEAVKAGINQFLDDYADAIRAALKDRLLTEANIDSVIRGNFRVMIKLGLLDPPNDNPYSQIGLNSEPVPWKSQKNKDLVKLATQKSIVLLKNDNQTLPLQTGKTKSIAVIGRFANEVLGDWYGGTPPYTITPLDGIRSRVGDSIRVSYAEDNSKNKAVDLAKTSDYAIVVVGNHPTGDAGWAKVTKPSYGKEAVDRKSINLEEEELIKQIYRVNPKTIVVLISSFPYAINWTEHNVPAILHMTHCSQEEGSALASVLFGDFNPAGRLVQTWPLAISQVPPRLDYDIRKGRTYMYFKGKPLYPFGFGLSYTTFQYSNLKVSSDNIQAGKPLTISFDITNTGKRAGDEVPQLYVRHLHSEVQRPKKELKGFKRITIKPGETKKVSLKLHAKDLAYWNEVKKAFTVEPDQIQLQIGNSSDDIRLTKEIQVTN